MSDTVQQPPYLIFAQVIRHPDVLDIAYLSAALVSVAVALAGGGPHPSEPAGTSYTDQQKLVRAALALKIIGRKLDQTTLATALVQIPEVAGALMSGDLSDPAAVLMSVNLSAAWIRNWT